MPKGDEDMGIEAKQLKKKLTLADYDAICNTLGLEMFSKSSSQWVYYNADVHKLKADMSPKLYFYIDTKIYMSYTAGRAYDIYGLVQAVKTTKGEVCSFVDAINFVLNITGYSDCITTVIQKGIYDWSNLERFVRIKHGVAQLPCYDDKILNQLTEAYYTGWIDEGISIDTMQKYGIKWYDRCSQIVIPCRDADGRLVGIRVRNLDPERVENAKYMPLILLDETVYKFPTDNVFYGINYNKPYIEETGKVILVEGEKSVLIADTWFGDKNNVLALYGSNIGLTRVKQLIQMGVNEVILALDSDFHEIGDKDYQKFETKILNIGKLFKGYCNVSVMYNNIELDNFYKCSPFDKGIDVYNQLWENREVVV